MGSVLDGPGLDTKGSGGRKGKGKKKGGFGRKRDVAVFPQAGHFAGAPPVPPPPGSFFAPQPVLGFVPPGAGVPPVPAGFPQFGVPGVPGVPPGVGFPGAAPPQAALPMGVGMHMGLKGGDMKVNGKGGLKDQPKRLSAEKITTAIPQYPPSRIVLLRRIAWSATQGILYDLGAQFGQVERVIMLRSKNHALIEFTKLDDAEKMVDYYKVNHDSIVKIGDHSATIGFCKHQNWVAPEASRTLLASLFDSAHRITECMYISPRVIFQLFAPFGAMEIVIVLPKKSSKNRVQALVQFTDIDQARNVKELLQGLPVWFGPNIQLALDLLYAKVNNLTHALLPGNTMVIPREVAFFHQELIRKYGDLNQAFNKEVKDMSFDEVEDFNIWRGMVTRHALTQAAELQKLFGVVTTEAEIDNGLPLALGMAAIHKPIEEDWVTFKGISLSEQQETLQTMEILIHNGGMAATGRNADKASDAGSDKDPLEAGYVPSEPIPTALELGLGSLDLAPPPDSVGFLAMTTPSMMPKDNDFACSAPAVLSSNLWGVKALITPSDREMVINPGNVVNTSGAPGQPHPGQSSTVQVPATALAAAKAGATGDPTGKLPGKSQPKQRAEHGPLDICGSLPAIHVDFTPSSELQYIQGLQALAFTAPHYEREDESPDQPEPNSTSDEELMT